MQRDKIKPILFSIIKHTPKEEMRRQVPRDILSGIMVAVVALPLSIALGIASGVGPATCTRLPSPPSSPASWRLTAWRGWWRPRS